VATFFMMGPPGWSRAVWFVQGVGYAVLVLAMSTRDKGTRGASPHRITERVRRFAPEWLQALVAISFVYALFSFIRMQQLNAGGTPGVVDGQLVLHDHGRVIRTLTADEFPRHELYVAQGFTGPWMFLYSVALLLLVASSRDQEKREAASGDWSA
jgi:hypothetical protein